MKTIAQDMRALVSMPAAQPSPAGFATVEAMALCDLNQHITQQPAATFYLRIQGDSMMQLGIFDADLLVVDRTLEPAHGDVVIVELNGERICKVLDLHFRQLLAGNDAYPSMPLRDIPALAIAGVVTHSLRYHRELS